MTSRIVSFPSLRQELLQLPAPSIGGVEPFEPLHIRVEWMRYCELCDSEQCFIADQRCETGLIAHCTKCGDRRLAPYSRTNSNSTTWEAYT